MRAAALVALVLAALPAAANQRHEGRAYAPGSERLLYSETHWRHLQAGVARRLVLYRCPHGTAFARKQLVATGSAISPDFGFIDGRDGYREGVRMRNGVREVYVQARNGAWVRSTPLTLRAGAVIDAGSDALVQARWHALAGQGALTVPFLLPSRLGFLDVRLAGSVGGARDGERVHRLRMTVDRWYGFAAPAIELTYSLRDRWLLQFVGIGPIRDDAGRHQPVRIEFPDPAVSGVPAHEIAAAVAVPLAGRCRSQG